MWTKKKVKNEIKAVQCNLFLGFHVSHSLMVSGVVC